MTETTIRFVERWKAKGKKAMPWQGLTPELITSNPACLLKLCLAMMKSFCYLPGKGCPDPAIPLLSQESRIPNLFHRYPEYSFLFQARIRAQISANPALRVAVKPVPISRLPNPALSFGQIRDPGNTLHARCRFNSSFFLVDSEKAKELR